MIRVVTLEAAEEWDNIVKSFHTYDVYYLSGYARGFFVHGDGEPQLLYYSGEKMRAIQVVMKRDIAQADAFRQKLPVSTYFDLCTPYGYGGWIVEGADEISQLMEEYEVWCKSHNIVSEFVRYHPQIMQADELDRYYERVYLGNTISMSLQSEEEIWNNLTSKNRNVIRKAIKNGLTVHCANDLQTYETFKKIYEETMLRDQANPYYYFSWEYYKSICEGLNDNSLVFHVKTAEGVIIAAAIILFANGRMHYHLSGTIKQYQSLAPSNLLLYEVACWGAKNGYTSFHLGGGLGAKEDSLFAFKKAFYRGDPLKYYVGKRIADIDTYRELVSKRNAVLDDKFFPQYRG